jgi:hypothetical protein
MTAKSVRTLQMYHYFDELPLQKDAVERTMAGGSWSFQA